MRRFSLEKLQDAGVLSYLLVAQVLLTSIPVLFFLFHSGIVSINQASATWFSCLMVSLSFVWTVWSWRKATSSLFDPYILFVYSAYLFNGGQAILELLDLNQYGLLDGEFAPGIIFETHCLITLALGAMHSGALFCLLKMRERDFEPPLSSQVDDLNVRRVGFLLLFVCIIPAVVSLRESLNLVMTQGYWGLYQNEFDTGLKAAPKLLAQFIVPAALFLLAGSQGRRSIIVISGLIVIAYSALNFFLGHRSVAFMPLVAFAWLTHRCVRRISKPLLLAGAVLAIAIIFPAIKAVRETSGHERASIEAIIEGLATVENPVVTTVSEFGQTAKTVAHVVELVPKERQFDLGIEYVYAALNAVPNFFWEVHPSASWGSYSTWLVWQIAPQVAEHGGGFGFSFIAEAYMNFGWIGTPGVLFIVGFLTVLMTIWCERSEDPRRFAAVATFMSFYLLFARSHTFELVRPLLWYTILPYMMTKILPMIRPRLSGTGPELEGGSCE